MDPKSYDAKSTRSNSTYRPKNECTSPPQPSKLFLLHDILHTYIHYPLLGLSCCFLHASFGLLCGGHHPLLGHGEPLHQYIHVGRWNSWAPLLQMGLAGWLAGAYSERAEVMLWDVRMCGWVSMCKCLFPGGSSSLWCSNRGLRGTHSRATALRLRETGGRIQPICKKMGRGGGEAAGCCSIFKSCCNPAPLVIPPLSSIFSSGDSLSCSAQPLAICLHILIGTLCSGHTFVDAEAPCAGYITDRSSCQIICILKFCNVICSCITELVPNICFLCF